MKYFPTIGLILLTIFISIFPCNPAFSSRKPIFSDFFESSPEEILKEMTLEEKIGQILMFGFWGKKLDKDYQYWLRSGKLGNIKIFLRNVESREQLQELTENINLLTSSSKHGIPPFIATDMEGGTVNHIRYDGIHLAPSAGLIGATGNIEYCRESSRLIAITLFNLGINMNFAPSADVLTSPMNRVVATRSYSSDPEVVFKMNRAFIEEHRKLGIVTTVKHYPGHGMSSFDSHIAVGNVDIKLDKLIETHLYPYVRLISEDKLDGVMVSHIIYTSIDPFYPAAFSKYIITDLLRSYLGFDGVIVTDDLEMEGAEGFAESIAGAFQLAFIAGNDLLLVAHTKKKQMELLEKAKHLFENGLLSTEELDRKVLRIIKLKKKYLGTYYSIKNNDPDYNYAYSKAVKKTEEAARNGITMISKKFDMKLPDFFKYFRKNKLKGIILSPSDSFTFHLKRFLPDWDVIDIGYYPNKMENYRRIFDSYEKLQKCDLAILGLANERQVNWADFLQKINIPFGIICIDRPHYALLFQKDALFIVASYSPLGPETEALYKCIFITGDFKGRIPYHFDKQRLEAFF